MDLDEVLDRSTPPTAPRTVTLQQELARMVANAETAVRPRRRLHRLGLASAVAGGVISVGTAGAMATGIVPTPGWIPWVTEAGSSCEMDFTAAAADSEDEPLSRTYTQSEKQRAVNEARRFLGSFDYSSINEAAAIREWKQSENAAIAAQADPKERQPRLTGDDLALTAVGRQVWDQLAADLAAHDIPTETIAFAQGWRCK